MLICYFYTTFTDAVNASNNVTGFTVLNNSVVTVDCDVLSTSKENGRSNSIGEGTVKDMTVSDVSGDVLMDGKDEIKDGDKDNEEKVDNAIEGGQGEGKGGAIAIDGDNQATVDVNTANDKIEVTSENEVPEKKEEKEETNEINQKEGEEDAIEEGGSHKKRKRSESCVDDSIKLPAIEKELIDEDRVTDANDTVLTTSTESNSVPDSENKVELNDALVAINKDENKVEKGKVGVDKSKSIAVVSAPLPVVRSFPVRQSALTDR